MWWSSFSARLRVPFLQTSRKPQQAVIRLPRILLGLRSSWTIPIVYLKWSYCLLCFTNHKCFLREYTNCWLGNFIYFVEQRLNETILNVFFALGFQLERKLSKLRDRVFQWSRLFLKRLLHTLCRNKLFKDVYLVDLLYFRSCKGWWLLSTTSPESV